MFFYLSKFLDFIISPVVIVMILVVAALGVPKQSLRKKLLVSCLSMLFLFTNPFITNSVMRWWQDVPDQSLRHKNYDAAIVLTGFMSYNTEYQQNDFGGSADRLTEALALYRKNTVGKIIISGGSGSLIDNIREANIARNFLIYQCHVPEQDILTDTISRNTRENAIESRRIMQDNNIKSALLITDAVHMPRSIGCFKKVGLNIDTYPVNITRRQRYNPTDLIVPQLTALNDWNALLHETTGYIFYKLAGYI